MTRQPLYLVLQRMHSFQKECDQGQDYETLSACFTYVVKTSGWGYHEASRALRSLAKAAEHLKDGRDSVALNWRESK